MENLRTIRVLLVAGLVACAAVGAARGAEVRLKAHARTSTSIVTLADVADVHAADEFQKQQLERIELGASPAPGSRRFVRMREVQDALWMRGINLALHQFSGVEQTEVIGPGEPVAEKAAAPITNVERERAEQFADDAVVRALQAAAGKNDPFQVKVALDNTQIPLILTYGGRMRAEGGAAPWTGKQQFRLASDDAKAVFDIEADVELPPSVVVVVKSLPAGSIVHIGDVALQPTNGVRAGVKPFHRVEDVVGMQTTWSIPAGTILDHGGVQRPQVVRKGDAVTLYARSAGLRVRTTVRAREGGSVGDLISVESLTDRSPLFARVTGVQEVEVYAEPAAAAAPLPAATIETMKSSQATSADARFAGAQGGNQR